MQFYGAVTEEPNFSIVTGKSHATHSVTNLYTYFPGMFFCPGIQSKHDVLYGQYHVRLYQEHRHVLNSAAVIIYDKTNTDIIYH